MRKDLNLNKEKTKIEIESNDVETDLAKENPIIPYDLKRLFIPSENQVKTELSYEKSLSKGLLDVIEHLHISSEMSKSESKAFAILSVCNPTLAKIFAKIVENKKDYKRKKEKVWLSVVNFITSAINRKEVENSGLLDNILHRNR